jgi:hypothetical protein
VSVGISFWPRAGTTIIEISATLQTLKLRHALSALDKAVLKVDGRLRVFSRPIKAKFHCEIIANQMAVFLTP